MHDQEQAHETHHLDGFHDHSKPIKERPERHFGRRGSVAKHEAAQQAATEARTKERRSFWSRTAQKSSVASAFAANGFTTDADAASAALPAVAAATAATVQSNPVSRASSANSNASMDLIDMEA